MKFIIVGAGDVGLSLSERLTNNQHDVILIEKNDHALNRIPSYLDLQILIGNGCSPEILLKAGIETADYFIAVADVDEVNVAACLAARMINPAVKRVARLRDINFDVPEIERKLKEEYFNLIINPDFAGARYLYQLFHFPGAKDVAEFAEGRLRVVGININKNSPYANALISSVRSIQSESPILIIAIIRDNTIIVPRGTDKIRPGDVVYALSEPHKTAALFKLAGHDLQEPSSAMIWGSTPLARFLTRQLEQNDIHVKLIMDPDDIQPEIVDEFESVLLLKGAGTDQNLLIEENVAGTDSFIAASSNQEDNILAALLAKQLGARTAMAVVNSSAYLSLVETIGVDVVVSTQLAAASEIFRHIHAGSVVSEFSLRERAATFMEFQVTESFPLLGKPIQDLAIPTGVLIVSIVRNDEIIIPSGENQIKVGDDIIIFFVRFAAKKLERLLEMDLELQ